MKKLFALVAATMLLAACQTTSVPVSSKQPPRVVTQKSIPEAKRAVIDELQDRGFKLVRNSQNRVVMELVLEETFEERKLHASYSDGTPRAQVIARFTKVADGTQVTAQNDMLINPGKKSQERVTLLDTPDGARLQRLLETTL